MRPFNQLSHQRRSAISCNPYNQKGGIIRTPRSVFAQALDFIPA